MLCSHMRPCSDHNMSPRRIVPRSHLYLALSTYDDVHGSPRMHVNAKCEQDLSVLYVALIESVIQAIPSVPSADYAGQYSQKNYG